jgi:hypothetical protein
MPRQHIDGLTPLDGSLSAACIPRHLPLRRPEDERAGWPRFFFYTELIPSILSSRLHRNVRWVFNRLGLREADRRNMRQLATQTGSRSGRIEQLSP